MKHVVGNVVETPHVVEIMSSVHFGGMSCKHVVEIRWGVVENICRGSMSWEHVVENICRRSMS